MRRIPPFSSQLSARLRSPRAPRLHRPPANAAHNRAAASGTRDGGMGAQGGTRSGGLHGHGRRAPALPGLGTSHGDAGTHRGQEGEGRRCHLQRTPVWTTGGRAAAKHGLETEHPKFTHPNAPVTQLNSLPGLPATAHAQTGEEVTGGGAWAGSARGGGASLWVCESCPAVLVSQPSDRCGGELLPACSKLMFINLK